MNHLKDSFQKRLSRISPGKGHHHEIPADWQSSPRASYDRTDQSNSHTMPLSGFIDLTIQFISAEGIPVMDAVGGADPYFKAKLGDKLEYISSAQKSTLSPVWNEVWHIKNVPAGDQLQVKLWDKDEGALRDDFIGKFETSVAESGLREYNIISRMGRKHGQFKLNIIPNPSSGSTVPPYTFAGPCRFSRHRSPTLGLFTISSTEERLYSSWKIYLIGIPMFFKGVYQPWNRNYPAAQKIFSGPLSAAVKAPIEAGHKLLYARTTANVSGVIHSDMDFVNLFKDEIRNYRIKPTVYTYIINDDTFRFSETGAAIFIDFASKHALHSSCAPSVRYSGEFHLRPAGGWSAWNESRADDSSAWELVIDNNSGTYAPDPGMLPAVRSLLEYNFPGMRVIALDREDPRLKESRDACREYAKTKRGISDIEVRPEVSLHRMSIKRHKK